MHLSFWEKITYLDGIDFAIIGSGIVGLNAAITLKEQFPKAKIVVFERGIFPSGASTKNAGFACFGSLSELIEDTEKVGIDAVVEVVAKRWRGLQKLRSRCGDQYLDYQSFGGYELFIEDEAHYQKCIAQIDFFNEKLAPILEGAKAYEVEKDVKKFGFGKVRRMIRNGLEGQINPAKMMERLRYLAFQQGIQILTGIEIASIEEHKTGVNLLIKNAPSIKAAKVLVATNGFTNQLLPDLALKPARNQVIITKPIPNLPLKGTFHYDSGYYYFRNFENRILLGGARNEAVEEETTEQFGLTSTIQNTLEAFLKTVILPQQSVEIDYRWSGILGVGTIKAPIVKKYSQHIAIAVRMGGIGVAIGSLVGEEGAKLLNTD